MVKRLVCVNEKAAWTVRGPERRLTELRVQFIVGVMTKLFYY